MAAARRAGHAGKQGASVGVPVLSRQVTWAASPSACSTIIVQSLPSRIRYAATMCSTGGVHWLRSLLQPRGWTR